MGVKLGLLTFREECRLRVFENRILQRIFGPKRDDAAREWRKLHSEELLHILYLSPDIIRQMTMTCVSMWYAWHKRRRWQDGIRMDLRETGLGGVEWIRLAQDRGQWRAVVSAVMNLRVLVPLC
jgi:hypothetical protein